MNRSLKWSIFLGNAFEHYDNALFALLSPFLAPALFPGQKPAIALLLTYAIIPIGMFIRPLGALFFGYIGDRRGRRQALFISLTGMSIVTGCMGFLPLEGSAGYIAPILFSLGRIFQNFFTAGESIGGAIYLIENGPKACKNRMSSFFNASTVAGILAASLGVSLLSGLNRTEEYWRILYWIGSLTALVGCMVRCKQSVLPAVSERVPIGNFVKLSLQTCNRYRPAIFAIAVAAGFSYATYTVALVMINGLVPLLTEIDQSRVQHLNTAMNAVDFLLLIISGPIVNRFRAERVMMCAGMLTFLTAAPLFWLLPEASFTGVIFVRLSLVLLGVAFTAPFHAWAQSLVPEKDRYTAVSFAYSLGTQLLGGPTGTISLWLFHTTGQITSLAWYWMALALLSSLLIAEQCGFSLLKKNKYAYKQNAHTESLF